VGGSGKEGETAGRMGDLNGRIDESRGDRRREGKRFGNWTGWEKSKNTIEGEILRDYMKQKLGM